MKNLPFTYRYFSLVFLFITLLFLSQCSQGVKTEASKSGDTLHAQDTAILQEPSDNTPPGQEAEVAGNDEPNQTKPAATPQKPASGNSNTAQSESGDWKVPAKYLGMVPPITGDKTSLETGKALYAKHCKSCHGTKGAGDGTKASALSSPMRSFQSPDFHTQKPGEIYYKSFVGRGEMPNYESKFPSETDRWAIVGYLMTLKN